MNDILLKVSGLNKQYTLTDGSLKYALKDVSFEMRQGESLGVIGTNGSGKSTLLKILSGITKPTSGRAEIFGTVRSILNLGYGIVPELTGLENILLTCRLEGLSKSETERFINEVAGFAEIGQSLYEPVRNYSDGMYLRLAFGLKTSLPCQLLLIDEVTRVGDLSFQQKSKKRMEALMEAGASICLVSHSLSEVTQFCTQCIIMDSGSIIDAGNPVDITSRYMEDNLHRMVYNHALNDPEVVSIANLELVKGAPGEGILIRFDLLKKSAGLVDISLEFHDGNAGIIGDSSLFRDEPARPSNQAGVFHYQIRINEGFTVLKKMYLNIYVGNGSALYLTIINALKIEPGVFPFSKQYEGNLTYPLLGGFHWQIS